jgi:hypothetical protein
MIMFIHITLLCFGGCFCGIVRIQKHSSTAKASKREERRQERREEAVCVPFERKFCNERDR